MTRSEPATSPAPGSAEQFSTRVVFFIAGFAMGAWAPLVPYAKARIGADDATLGLVLLCLGMGSILAMPLAAWLAACLGCRKVVIAASLALCAILPLLAVAPTVIALGAAVLAFGAAVGAVDVTISIQAVLVERASGRAMMSGFHGLYSVGGIAGAGGMGFLLWLGAAPAVAAVAIAAAIAALLLASQRHLLPYAGESTTSVFAVPHGFVLLIGGLTFIAYLAEGAMLDWSAVFLTVERGLRAAFAGGGYAAFAAAMTLGRFTGDAVVRRMGSRRVLAAGALGAASGLALAVLAPRWPAAIAGFTLVGLGASNIVPVLYSALGRQRAVSLNVAMAAVSTLGYLGILCGPALIGFVAQKTGLPVALLGVAALLVLLAASAPVAIEGRRRAT
jgi:predicted MFS family arabinose efflux permease